MCWEIYRHAVLEGAAPHYTSAQRQAWAPDESDPREIWDQMAKGRTWIAEHRSVAVGFLSATGIGGDGDAFITLLFVMPDVRRTDVAPALYNAFRSAAEDADQGDRLATDASSMLRPFLERRGWSVQEEEWVSRGGVWLNRFRMAKRTLSEAGDGS